MTLGFIDGAGKPTAEYSKLKGNKATVGAAVAEGITKAYAPLYEANEKAHELPPDELKGLIAQVSGAEDSLIGFIVGTFKNLVKLADFSASTLPDAEEETDQEESGNGKAKANEQRDEAERQRNTFKPDFRFNRLGRIVFRKFRIIASIISCGPSS